MIVGVAFLTEEGPVTGFCKHKFWFTSRCDTIYKWKSYRNVSRNSILAIFSIYFYKYKYLM